MESKKLPSLFSLTWPIFIELGLQVLVGNVDQMMISRYSENSVSAIGNSSQLINLLILLFSIISLAATILISQYRGAGRPDKGQRDLHPLHLLQPGRQSRRQRAGASLL